MVATMRGRSSAPGKASTSPSRRRRPAASAIAGRRSRPAPGSASTACGFGSFTGASGYRCWSPRTSG
jgi:hypothetical protein